jgi:small subunit ribosomal protein S26e
MPQKRRNCGRSKMNAGHKHTVNCLNCGRLVPRDKAIKRFMQKNMVDASSAKDVLDACVYKDLELPKSYQKAFYCVSCAVHRRIVRVRNHNVRHLREPLYLKHKKERAAEAHNREAGREHKTE